MSREFSGGVHFVENSTLPGVEAPAQCSLRFSLSAIGRILPRKRLSSSRSHVARGLNRCVGVACEDFLRRAIGRGEGEGRVRGVRGIARGAARRDSIAIPIAVASEVKELHGHVSYPRVIKEIYILEHGELHKVPAREKVLPRGSQPRAPRSPHPAPRINEGGVERDLRGDSYELLPYGIRRAIVPLPANIHLIGRITHHGAEARSPGR